jgi:hypothetical protein
MKNKLLIALAALLFFLGLLPTFLSSTAGKNALFFFLNKTSSFQIQAEKISLSWVHPLTIEKLSLKDPAKSLSLECSEITLTSGLMSLLWKPYKIGEMVIKEPSIQIAATSALKKDFTSPIQTASFLSTNPLSFHLFKELFSFEGSLKILQGKLFICESDVVFSPIECSFIVDGKEKAAKLSAKASTFQKNQQGDLFFEVALQEGITFQASCSHLPLEGLNQIFSFFPSSHAKLALAALGPSLDLTCHGSFSQNLYDVFLKAQSENLTASMQILSKDDQAVLANPAKAKLLILPSVLEELSSLFPEISSLFPKNPLLLDLTLDTLKVPFYAEGPSFHDALFTGSFSLEEKKGKKNSSILASSTISSKKLSEEMTAKLQVSTNGLPALSMEASAQKIFTKDPFVFLSLEAKKASTLLLDELFACNISDLIGSELSSLCTFSGNLQKAEITVNLKSPLMQMGESHFSYQDKKLSLFEPVRLFYVLHPAILQHHLGKSLPPLQKDARFSMEISEFSFEESLQVKASFQMDPLYFPANTIPSFGGTMEMQSLSDIFLQISGGFFSLDSRLSWQKDMLSLKEPLLLHYTWQEEQIPNYAGRPHLREEAKMTLTLSQASMSLQQRRNLALKGSITFAPIHLENDARTRKISIENTQASFSILEAQDEIKCLFQTDVLTEDKKGAITGSCQYLKFFSSKDLANVTTKVQTEHFPIDSLHFFLSDALSLTSLLGENIQANVQFTKTPKEQSLVVNAETELVQMSGEVLLFQDKITLLRSPAKIAYKLTPEGYQALAKTAHFFSLKDPVFFSAKVTECCLPLPITDLASHLEKVQIKAFIESSDASFLRAHSSDAITLTNSKFSLQKSASEKDLHILASAQTKSAKESFGSFTLQSVITPMDEKQSLPFPFSMNAQVQVAKFPSTILDILCLKKKDFFSTILGPSLELCLDFSVKEGAETFSCDFSSSQSKFHFLGKLQEGNLQLLDAMQISLAITPEASKLFLEGKNPLSLKHVSSYQPVTITVIPKGFSFPIKSFNPNLINAEFIKIDLGKIFCKNEGNIHSALKALKYKKSDKEDIELWFAPAICHIKQGIIDIERTEVLVAKALDLALWGQIDLPKNFVSMTMGITASALKETMGLKNLPNDYVLKIPLQGPLNNVELKTKSATSTIAALLLWQSDMLAGKLGPLGGVLQKVIPPPGGEGKTPPPKTPFPWQAAH